MMNRTAKVAGLIGLLWGMGVQRAQADEGEAQVTQTSTLASDCLAADELPREAYTEASRWFEQGTEQAQQFLFDDAEQSYQQALRHWRDPRVYYNLSRMQVALDRPLEAYRNVLQAIRCGPEPLGDDSKDAEEVFDSAVALRDRLLMEELAALVLVSKESGIRVKTDEKEPRVLQHRDAQFLVPRAHTLAVEKDGYVSRSQTVTPPRGQTLTLEVTSHRTFEDWLPWTILGVGGALTITGGVLYGTSLLDEGTDVGVCFNATNCPELSEDSGIRRDSVRQTLGIGGLVVGGLVVLGGAGLLWWSPSPTLQMTPVDSATPNIVPIITDDGAGVFGEFVF